MARFGSRPCSRRLPCRPGCPASAGFCCSRHHGRLAVGDPQPGVGLRQPPAPRTTSTAFPDLLPWSSTPDGSRARQGGPEAQARRQNEAFAVTGNDRSLRRDRRRAVHVRARSVSRRCHGSLSVAQVAEGPCRIGASRLPGPGCVRCLPYQPVMDSIPGGSESRLTAGGAGLGGPRGGRRSGRERRLLPVSWCSGAGIVLVNRFAVVLAEGRLQSRRVGQAPVS